MVGRRERGSLLRVETRMLVFDEVIIHDGGLFEVNLGGSREAAELSIGGLREGVEGFAEGVWSTDGCTT